MRICIIGKFPPIQGGVSMRTYWTAYALAARGHDAHVVTNAEEVRAPFRMHMRAQDWERCAPKFASGAVTMHWTESVDGSQSHIPMANPFVAKLATLAANVHAAQACDVIFSHYMEPYCIAGHLAAQMTGVPHVVRMAGSDAGRLWHHPQFEALYDHVLRSAAAVVVTGTVAERAAQRGVDPGRIVSGGAYALPAELFTPDGSALDPGALSAELAADSQLRDAMWGEFAGEGPWLGVYGKLGLRKGSFALLEALHRLKRAGLRFGLLALAHGNVDVEQQFREKAAKLDLRDRVLQIPFLPHWRVPEFLRLCHAVCCLEQDFPIGFHSPITPCEVLLCGTCLVATAELIKKLPGWKRLPHGYGCLAVEDVNDTDLLAERLSWVLRDPPAARRIGARGRAFALDLQRDIGFPMKIESILLAAAKRRPLLFEEVKPDEASPSSRGFALTEIAAAAIGESRDGVGKPTYRRQTAGVGWARTVLNRIERGIAQGRSEWCPMAQAVQVEIAIAAAEADQSHRGARSDPLFRLQTGGWAFEDDDLAALVPVRDGSFSVVRFDFDVAALRNVRCAADFPSALVPRPSFLVVFGRCGGECRDPLMVDGFTAQVLELCDGTRTAGTIVEKLNSRRRTAATGRDLRWIEHLFVQGLIQLQICKMPPRAVACLSRW